MSEIASMGFGVLTDIFITDNVQAKLSVFKDKKAIKEFTKSLMDWEIQFEQQHDGTVATSSAFFSYIENNHVIENVISFVVSPSFDSKTEEEYLRNLSEKMISDIENKKNHKLSNEDTSIVYTFLKEVLNRSRDFVQNKVASNDRGLLYLLTQINAQINENIKNGLSYDDIIKAIQDSPHLVEIKQSIIDGQQLTADKIEELEKQLLEIRRSNETADSLYRKLLDWNKREIQNLGDRYLPDVNVPVELTKTLNGLSLNENFISLFLNKSDSFLIEMKRLYLNELIEKINELESCVINVDFFSFNADFIGHLTSILTIMDNLLEEKCKVIQKDKDLLYRYYRAINIIAEYRDYLESSEILSAVTPYILLVGDGGSGKSHLIADHVNNSMRNGIASMLLLGQQFNSEGPLSMLPHVLGTSITYQELFQAFEDTACRQNARFLLCIDALNEGPGVHFWNCKLGGLLEFIKKYPHIGLLVSVRSQYENPLFDEQESLHSQFVRVLHTGFTKVMYEATRKYFEFFKITTDELIALNNEFTNPLFLRIFCVAHTGKKVSLNELSLPNVYSKYIDHIERQIAKRCDYPPAIHLVQKIIDRLVAERINQSQNAVRLPLDTVLSIVIDFCKKFNISKDVYSALLNEGVLTQGINYKNEEYVNITYERLEDYFIASKIVEEFNNMSSEEFSSRYDWLLKKTDLLQFVWIVLAEEKSIELSSVLSSQDEGDKANMRQAFLYSLLWRKNSTISESSMKYINSEILQYESSFKKFVDVLFALSTRPHHQLNAKRSHHFFANLSLPDRDAEFIPIFDKLYFDTDSALYRLLNWGLYYSQQDMVDKETIELSSIILCWLLISPNNELRDKATKALVSILSDNLDILKSVMECFQNIDDPYILERIYAVAFGCSVTSTNNNHFKELSTYVFDSIFNKEDVYPNILLRTYAKNIIDFALYCGCISEKDFPLDKSKPPYHSSFPDVPPDSEIKGYSVDDNSPGFKRYYYSQQKILHSMKVEYSRDGQPGGYGDFGRYTFQNYFREWANLDPMDLKNIAIKRIFELGYDVEKHGIYDYSLRDIPYHGKRERIGKKYQWIAFYELAAQVSDNFPLSIHPDNTYDDAIEFYAGSYYPNIRNIDPTVLVEPQHIVNWVPHEKYYLPQKSYEEWLENFDDCQPFNESVRLTYNGKNYVLLYGRFNWLDRKKLGYEPYDLPRKNLWQAINGYLVKQIYVKDLLSALDGHDFMGNWMPQVYEDYAIYNREFYWSDAYQFYKNGYYGNSEWVTIDQFREKIDFDENMLLPVRLYCSERKGDTFINKDGAILHWYTICGDIFETLNLQYHANSNSCLYDQSGNLICFDSSELLGEDMGYFIEENQLNAYLRKKHLCLIWTSLSEKQIIGPDKKYADIPSKAIHNSEIYQYTDGVINKTYGQVFIDRLYF